MKLNGWQRLWVLISACWIAFVLIDGIRKWPQAAPLARYSLLRTGLTAEQGAAAELAYARTQALLGQERREHVVTVMMLTFGPCIALYALGYGVEWTRRGFRKEE